MPVNPHQPSGQSTSEVHRTFRLLMEKWKHPANLYRDRNLSYTLQSTAALRHDAAKVFECPIYDDQHARETKRQSGSDRHPCGMSIHLMTLQSLAQELTPFASLSAIPGTFNSLSKVLFIFPSRYLFAIGLKSVFSFRRQLPPVLHTKSKVRDSTTPHRMHYLSTWTGFSPSVTSFSNETYAGDDTGDSAKDYNSKTSFGFTL